MLQKFNYLIWSCDRKKMFLLATSSLYCLIGLQKLTHRYRLNSDALLNFTTFLSSKMLNNNNDFYFIILLKIRAIILVRIPRIPFEGVQGLQGGFPFGFTEQALDVIDAGQSWVIKDILRLPYLTVICTNIYIFTVFTIKLCDWIWVMPFECPHKNLWASEDDLHGSCHIRLVP